VVPVVGLINELMALNREYYVVSNSTPDWVELYNNTAAAQNLAGWSLANIASDGQSTNSWIFPPTASIQPWGHLVVFCNRHPAALAGC
jgi:hypothetical protein